MDKKLASIFCMFLLSFSAFSNEIVSGFVFVDPEHKCRIIWGNESEQISCTASVFKSANTGMVQLDFSKLALRLPPICTFSQSAGPDGVGGLKTFTPLLGNFNTNKVDILIKEASGVVPVGGITTFICTIN